MRVCPAAQPSHQHHLSLCHTQTQLEALKHPLRRVQARLRPKRGGLVKYSGRPRLQQTTRRRCQVSRGEQPLLATWRLPRPSSAAPLQCALMNSNVRRDIPATKHCTSFLLPPCDIKGREEQPLQGLDHLLSFRSNSIRRDLGPTPSPVQIVTPTTNTPNSGTRQLDTRCRVLLLGGSNQSNPVVTCANHPILTHDRHKFTVGGREPRQLVRQVGAHHVSRRTSADRMDDCRVPLTPGATLRFGSLGFIYTGPVESVAGRTFARPPRPNVLMGAAGREAFV
jgi:hypothetical protein